MEDLLPGSGEGQLGSHLRGCTCCRELGEHSFSGTVGCVWGVVVELFGYKVSAPPSPAHGSYQGFSEPFFDPC